jgi:hypothetical protein
MQFEQGCEGATLQLDGNLATPWASLHSWAVGGCWHFLAQSPSEEVLSPSPVMVLEMPIGIS